MANPSKSKGSGFEREVAKFLSEHYGETFIRAPGSGAYTGGSNSHRKQILHDGQIRSFKGDIIPGQNFPLFNAEAKFHADFGFHQLYEESKQLEEWIKQLLTAADDGDLNILFMKFNRKGRYIAVQASIPWNTNCNHTIYTSKQNLGTWVIYNFEKFFELNSTLVKTLSQKSDSTSTTNPDKKIKKTLLNEHSENHSLS